MDHIVATSRPYSWFGPLRTFDFCSLSHLRVQNKVMSTSGCLMSLKVVREGRSTGRSRVRLDVHTLVESGVRHHMATQSGNSVPRIETMRCPPCASLLMAAVRQSLRYEGLRHLLIFKNAIEHNCASDIPNISARACVC